MEYSETFAEIAKAMVAAWGEIKTPKHNRVVKVYDKNTKKLQYEFPYADLAAILEAINEPFKKNKLMVLQDTRTEKVPNTNYTELHVSTVIMHESGEYVKGGILTRAAGGDIKQLGGDITYLKRYSLSALLGLATEQDRDAFESENPTEVEKLPKNTTNKGAQQTQNKNQGGNTQNNSNGNKGAKNQNNAPTNPPHDEHNQVPPEEPKKEVEKITTGQRTTIDVRIAAIAKEHNVPKDEVYPRFQYLYDMVKGEKVTPDLNENMNKTTAAKIIKKLEEHLASKQPFAGLPEIKIEGDGKDEQEGKGVEQTK